jgi:hypothetical protein
VGTSPNQQLVNTNTPNLGTMRVPTGWQEISTYLRSGARTVQQWEILGLPLHPIGGGPRRPVIAFAEELDAWQRAAPTRFLHVVGLKLGTKWPKVEDRQATTVALSNSIIRSWQ